MVAEAISANRPTDVWSTFEQTAQADLLHWLPKNADADFHTWKVQHATDFVRSMYISGYIQPSFISTAYGTTEPHRFDPTGIAYLIKKIVSDVYTFDTSIAQDAELIAGAAQWDRMPLLSPMHMEQANAHIGTPEGNFPLLPFAIGSYAHNPDVPVVYDVRSQNSLCFIGNRRDRVNAMKRIVQSARYMNPTESLQLISVQDEQVLDEVGSILMGHDLTFPYREFPSVMDMVEANGKRPQGKTHLLFLADSLENCFRKENYATAYQSLDSLSLLQEQGVPITWILGMDHELYSNLQKTAVFVSSRSVLFPYNGQTHIFRGRGDHTLQEVVRRDAAMEKDLHELPAGAYLHEQHYTRSYHTVDMMWPLGGGEL